jgi:hypothetical protein
VASENSSSIQEQLGKQGVRVGRDVVLKCSHRSYVNAEIFLNYTRTVFLPYLVGLRGLVKFATEDEVLMMDNCTAHAAHDVIRLLTGARVLAITFASSTTEIFQVLDRMLFGVLKRRPRYELPFESDNATVK